MLSVSLSGASRMRHRPSRVHLHHMMRRTCVPAWRLQGSSGSSSSAALVRITRQVITVPLRQYMSTREMPDPSSSLAPVHLPSALPTPD